MENNFEDILRLRKTLINRIGQNHHQSIEFSLSDDTYPVMNKNVLIGQTVHWVRESGKILTTVCGLRMAKELARSVSCETNCKLCREGY